MPPAARALCLRNGECTAHETPTCADRDERAPAPLSWSLRGCRTEDLLPGLAARLGSKVWLRYGLGMVWFLIV